MSHLPDIFGVFFGIVYLAAAVYMIINPDVVGGYSGWAGHSYVNAETPGCMIRAAGCCMLALIPALLVGGLSAVLGIVVGLLAAATLYVAAARFFG